MSNHDAKVTPSYGVNADPGQLGRQQLRRVGYRAHCPCGFLGLKTSYRYASEQVRRHNLDGWTPK